nr:uncharacterized protein LOC109172861 [Ipomoea trifida]
MTPKILSTLYGGRSMMVPLLETIELLSYNLHFLQVFMRSKTEKKNWDTRDSSLYKSVENEVDRIYYKYKIESKPRLIYAGGYWRTKAEDTHHLLKSIVRDIEFVKDLILKEERRAAALEAEEQNITIWDTYRNALKTENEVIVGLDSDIERIVNRLCYSYFGGPVLTILKNSNIDKFRKYVLKLQVMALVGEGGIGKTTLAKRVYRHPTTNASFHIRASVVVSKVHNLKEILIVASSDKKPNFKMVPNLKELGIYIEGQLAPSYLGSLVYLNLLETLKFEVGRVERFYLPTDFPPNLKKLTLRYTYLSWKDMDTIGKLPHLEVLKLKDFACCGSKWEPSEPSFRELKTLLISRSDLKHWNASSNNFPILERLVLRYCWELKQVPLKFAKIGTLELIVLECCYSSLVTSAKQISSENKLLFLGKTDCPLRVCKVGIKVELPNNKSFEEESVESSKKKVWKALKKNVWEALRLNCHIMKALKKNVMKAPKKNVLESKVYL